MDHPSSSQHLVSVRFQLWELFVITVFCAIMAWCATQYGFMNGGFIVGLIACSATSAVFVSLASNRGKRWKLFFYLIAGLLVATLLFSSLAVFVHLLLTLVAAIVCTWFAHVSYRTRCAIAMSVMGIAFVMGTIPIRSHLQRLRTLRTQFPPISILNRLKYERDRPNSAPAELLALSPTVTTRLNQEEKLIAKGNHLRTRFQRLHDEAYERFIRSTGFGFYRMAPLRLELYERAPLRDISLKDRNETLEDGWWGIEDTPPHQGADAVHAMSRNDFLDANGFGFVRPSLLEAVGFIEHAFHYPPNANITESKWEVTQLELISLRRYPEPRVYVLDHLPRMDPLARDDVRTRPLDEFERSALPRLASEEDTVIVSSGETYRMVGSLRAAYQCLECHQGQRGELLGAFTYVIRAISPTLPKAEAVR